MKEKLKDFYEKNKEKIQNGALFCIGGTISVICGIKIYKDGKEFGLNLGWMVFGLLIEKALEKNPDISVKEFANEEFMVGLAKEIVESYK